MHNFLNMYQFEVLRILRKKSFWIATLAGPLLLAIILAISVTSANSTVSAIKNFQSISFQYIDNSGLINTQLPPGFQGSKAVDEPTGIEAVKSGKIQLFFELPANLSTGIVKIYGKEISVFNNSRYQNFVTYFLTQLGKSHVDNPNFLPILTNNLKSQTITYKDGKKIPDLKEVLPSLVFLILFFLMVQIMTNFALNSSVEEKENRVLEMLLISVSARAYLQSKIAALATVGLTQILVFLLPTIIAYFTFRQKAGLPDLSTILADPSKFIFGFAFLIIGITMIICLAMLLANFVSTAKEAAPYFSLILISEMIPFYALQLVLNQPNAPLVHFLQFFPLTAPVTGMLLNSFGNLSISITLISLLDMVLATFLAFYATYRTFQKNPLRLQGSGKTLRKIKGLNLHLR